MSVNRFTGPVGPTVSVITLPFTYLGTNLAASVRVDLPAGMGFVITSASAYATAVTSDPSLTIGTTTAATAIVAAVNVTTNLGALTLKTGVVAAGGNIVATITNDAGDVIRGGSVNLVGYFTGFPTEVVTAIERS